MTEQEQKAFTAMREALEGLLNTRNDDSPESVARAILYNGKARRALTAANAVSHPQATEPACKTCKHFTQGKNPLVGTYEMQCFECCNYYASKWEERDAHHE